MRSGGLEQCTGPTFFFSCGGAGVEKGEMAINKILILNSHFQ